MDAITMLKADHKEVKGLFREFEAAGERAHQKKQRLGDEICHELGVHAALEEQIFYPAAKEKGPSELGDVVDESLEEHHVMKLLIGELRSLQSTDEAYEPKMTVLMENTEHHIEEEEKEFFPQAQKALGKELDTLGERMAALKGQLLKQGAGTPAR
jgi:hemerythrin-like domain-containing protein